MKTISFLPPKYVGGRKGLLDSLEYCQLHWQSVYQDNMGDLLYRDSRTFMTSNKLGSNYKFNRPNTPTCPSVYPQLMEPVYNTEEIQEIQVEGKIQAKLENDLKFE